MDSCKSEHVENWQLTATVASSLAVLYGVAYPLIIGMLKLHAAVFFNKVCHVYCHTMVEACSAIWFLARHNDDVSVCLSALQPLL